jgi:transcriptional regulator with XRE-family HTH domain
LQNNSNIIITFAPGMSKELYNKRRKQIGFLLQHERKCQHLEQEVVAQKMDVKQEDISKIESGTRRIDILELIDYAEVLGFSITEVAWKIDMYLSALRLLPLPNRNVLDKKIKVEISWSENCFSASLGDIVQDTFVFTANNFDELQIEIIDGFDSHIKRMVADGNKVPWWLVKKEYEFEYKFLDATSLLKAYNTYISLAVISRITGINQNQLSQYANGLKKARPNQLKRIAEAIQKIGKDLTAVVP